MKYTRSDTDSNEFYHSQPGISASGLKKLRESPAHFMYEERKETEAMKFGTMYHHFILEPETFYQTYQIVDTSKRPDQKHSMAAKENSIWLATFDNPVSEQMHEQLKAMKAVLWKHPYARSLLTNGEAEVSYYCEIDIGAEKPIKVRLRPDNVKHKKRIVVDLKTAKDASVDGFKKDAANLKYHIQAAFYADLMELIMEEELGYEFFFVAQEKVKPYNFGIFQASPQFRAVGKYEWELLLMVYAWCLENDKWPGYQLWCANRYGVEQLDLPAWAIKEMDYFPKSVEWLR
ncbi:MAG: PD-(D/E)XK nuclease-like domain-containing protein [Deltaproteobacteria bacterium]|nr:PD-(D/E)XK nuclease-like domain-containing protein [Deltaproteobacteria bacterium]